MIHRVLNFPWRSRICVLCLTLYLIAAQLFMPLFTVMKPADFSLVPDIAPAVYAAPRAALASRYVIFLGGINSLSSTDKPYIDGMYKEIGDALVAQGMDRNRFVYFSYSGARRSNGEQQAYCLGWGDDNCQDGNNLVDLFRNPIYVKDDTHLSVIDQAEVLNWLIEQIIKLDSTAEISLIGFSLGGVVASYWSATHDANSPLHGHIHSITLINSPVGGIPLANAFRDGCSASSWISVANHAREIVGAASKGLRSLYATLLFNALDPNEYVEDACIVWEALLKEMFGAEVLRQLQLPIDDETGAQSVIDELPNAAVNYRLTAIESTNDYLVNGEQFPLCGTALCLESQVLSTMVGHGTEMWQNTQKRVGTFGGTLVTNPHWNAIAGIRILDNHNATLKNTAAISWVIENLRLPSLAAIVLPAIETSHEHRHSIEFVSGPSNTIQLTPGDSQRITWELRHTGTGLMGEEYYLTVLEGDSMVSPNAAPLDDNNVVAPDDTGKFTFEITAPQQPGTYTVRWQMEHADTGLFGPILTLELVVPDSPLDSSTRDDKIAPTASDFTASLSGGTVTLAVSGVSDNASGVREVRYSAKFGNNDWIGIGATSSAPYILEWDMCASGVPDGDVELGMEVWDRAGNKFVWSDPNTNRHITKNFNCVASPPSPQEGMQKGIYLYRNDGLDSNRDGGPCIVTEDAPSIGEYCRLHGYGDGWNDDVESVRTTGSYYFVLYRDDNYGGGEPISGNFTEKLSDEWRNQVSSIRVRNEENPAFTLYERGDFGGTEFKSDRTIYDLGHWRWNDMAESIRVHVHGQVLICTDANFFGTCERRDGPGEWSDINAFGQGLKDAASSVRFCDGECPHDGGKPTLYFPASGQEITAETPVVLEWGGALDQFYVEIWGGGLIEQRKLGWTSDVQWDLGALPASEQPYQWRVKGWRGYGEGPWAEGTFYVVSADEPRPMEQCNDAPEYELTDGTNGYQLLSVAAGTPVTISWSLGNSGECPWPELMELVVLATDMPSETPAVPVLPLATGESQAVTISFIAPSEPDTYFLTWQLKTSEQQPIGQSLTVALEVTESTLPPVAEVCAPTYELVEPGRREMRFQLEPGTSISVPWRIVNPSGCTWSADGVLMVTDTTLPTAPEPVTVPALGPGETHDLGIVLVAPAASGVYETTWQMYSTEGAFVGDTLTAVLEVSDEGDGSLDAPEVTGGTGTSVDEPSEENPDGESPPESATIPIEQVGYVHPTDSAVYVYVPPGEFIMGAPPLDDSNYAAVPWHPEHVVHLPGYWIRQQPVLHTEFADCVAAGACDDSTITSSGFSWHQAWQYARWVGGRLPTEAEWEKMCRGTNGQKYPWGNDGDEPQEDIELVRENQKHRGISPYGALNVANQLVPEWTSSLVQSYPYNPVDGREDLEALGPRVTRGRASIGVVSALYTNCYGREAAEVEPDPESDTAYTSFNSIRVVLDDTVVPQDARVPLASLTSSEEETERSTTTPGDPQLVAFQDGEQGSLYVVREDGSGLTLLAESNRSIYDYAWSPDGAYIAFVMRADSSAGSVGLYVVNIATGEQTFLAEADAWSPVAWHGTKIAFVRANSAVHDIGEIHDLLSYVDLRDGQLRYHDVPADLVSFATEVVHFSSLEWSPDGAWLAVDHMGFMSSAFHVTGDYPPRSIGLDPSWIAAASGSWEAIYIACALENTAGRCAAEGIWRHDVGFDRATMFHTLLAPDGEEVHLNTAYAAFSPDRKHVAYTYPYLFLLDPETGIVEQLTTRTVRQPAWSPQGDTILYAAWDLSGQIFGQTVPAAIGLYRFDLTTREETQISAMAAWRPSWQPLADPFVADLSQLLASVEPVEELISAEPTANENANLRAGPGTDYPKLGRVEAGTVLIIIGRNAAGDWCQLASGEWIAAFLVDNVPPNLPEVAAPTLPTAEATAEATPVSSPTPQPTAAPQPTKQPDNGGNGWVVFIGDPRNSSDFCDGGFRSDCGFAGCGSGSRLVWGPFCRARDHSYIQEPGLYRVTVYGTGRVIAGATDFGPTEERYTFGSQELTLPGSYTFCWPGLASDGFGFETVVEGIDGQARVDRMVIEFMGENCN